MKPLKVLNVSSGDLVGSRFNGFDWHDSLKALNVDTKMLVSWNHNSKHEWVDLISEKLAEPQIRSLARLDYQASQLRGREDSHFWWAHEIFNHSFYKECDVVHLQIIQDGTLDLQTIQRIFREKPTLWTWHDPWPLTGHCVYPMDCNRFSSGCGECPDLKRAFAIGKDFTKTNRDAKNKVFSTGYTLHVATKWFAEYIQENDTIDYPKPHVIPFGLDLNRFRVSDKRQSRVNLGLNPRKFTIGIRAVREPQKNFALFVSALAKITNPEDFQIVTLQEKGLLGSIGDRFEVTELAWSNSEEILSDFYGSLDLFVMPSRYETFGLMALESMSSGVPIVGVLGTAVEEITNLKSFGFPITGISSKELSEKIISAFIDPIGLAEKGSKGREWVEAHYALDSFAIRLRKLYDTSIENFMNV